MYRTKKENIYIYIYIYIYNIIIIIIIINEQLQQAALTQRYYIAGGLGEEERGNHGKVGVKRKCWVLAQPPYSLQGNGKHSPRLELGGISHPMRRRTQGAGIVKG